MITLEKKFESEHILYASELNLIVDKINEIIRNFPTPSSGGSSKDTQDDYTKGLNDVKKEIEDLKQALQDIENSIKDADDGRTETKTDEEWTELIKKTFQNGDETFIKAVLISMGLVDSSTGKPYITSTVIDEYNGYATLILQLSNKVGILVDKDNNIKPAAIVAAINDSGSTVSISADKILIDGNTTLSGKLNSISAEIKDAVIDNLEAGDVTITGKLNYTGIFGEVYTISTSGEEIPSTAYYVSFGFLTPSGSNPDSYYVYLPSNPTIGQTLYVRSYPYTTIIPKTGTCEKSVWYYNERAYYDNESGSWSGNYVVTRQAIDNTYEVSAMHANLSTKLGVYLFIYDGSKWVEL